MRDTETEFEVVALGWGGIGVGTTTQGRGYAGELGRWTGEGGLCCALEGCAEHGWMDWLRWGADNGREEREGCTRGSKSFVSLAL